MNKSIEKIIAPPHHHFVGDGFRVHNFVPGVVPMQRMDPFIMLDYNSKFFFPPTDTPRGVSVHPHRGFETVTIAYHGKVAHHDSSGGGGVIAEGDVQWMTAASGVLHKEYHEKEWSKAGGDFQVAQIWVNLPSQFKMSTPKYQAIENKNIPIVTLDDNQGTVEVIAGEYMGTKGIASTFTPIHMFNAKLNANGKAHFSLPQDYNTLAIVIEGSVQINEQSIPTDHLVLFKNDGTDFEIQAANDAIVLILSGEPINEPIAPHGPFVMNTREEILQAFHDYQSGKFGYLEE